MAKRAAALFTFCLSLALGSSMFAIGPTLPLAFDDSPDPNNPWVIRLRVDPQLITAVRVERQVFQLGKALRTEKVEIAPDYATDRKTPVDIPIQLRFKGIDEIEPGVYALRVIAEGSWTLPGNNKLLHIERFFYFVVKAREVTRIGAEDYERVTDPPEDAIDSDGKKTAIRVGSGISEKVPLPRTKATMAIPLGHLGGVAEENPTGGAQRQRYRPVTQDKSETKEQ